MRASRKHNWSVLFISAIFLVGCTGIKSQVKKNVGNIFGEELESPVPEPQKLPSGEIILFSDDFSGYDLGEEPTPWWHFVKGTSMATVFVTQDVQRDGKVGKVLEGKFGGINIEEQDYLIAGHYEWQDYIFQVYAKQLDAGYDVPSLIFRYRGDRFYLLEIGETTRLYKVVGGIKTKIGERRIDVKVDDKAWHKITIMVDKNKIFANIDGHVIFDGFTDNDPAMRKGKIGLGGHEYGWRIHYDDVLVLEMNEAAKKFYQRTLMKE